MGGMPRPSRYSLRPGAHGDRPRQYAKARCSRIVFLMGQHMTEGFKTGVVNARSNPRGQSTIRSGRAMASGLRRGGHRHAMEDFDAFGLADLLADPELKPIRNASKRGCI
jgi:hypothetical protein